MTQYLGKKMPTLWQDPQYATDGLAMYTAFLNRMLRRSEEGEDRAKKAYYALKQGVGTVSGFETLEDFAARAMQLEKTFDMYVQSCFRRPDRHSRNRNVERYAAQALQ